MPEEKPKFIVRLGRSEESICTTCYLTIRAIPGVMTLLEVQEQHKCSPLDLLAVTTQTPG